MFSKRPFLCKCTLLLAIFLNLLGFTMIGPIIPSLRAHFSLTEAELGMLSGAFPMGMLASLFLWPALSDSLGRKRVFIICLTGVATGLLLQSLCVVAGWKWYVFFLLRFFTGIFSSLSPVAKAYLGDVCEGAELSQWMARREASGNGAFIVGPALGGLLLSKTSAATVIGTASGASFLAAFLVAWIMESKSVLKKNINTNAAEKEKEKEKKQVKKAVASICVVSFFYHVGQSTFDAFYSTFLTTRFGYTPKELGAHLTAMACVSLFVSSFVYRPLEKRAGLVSILMIGAGCVALFLFQIGGNITRGQAAAWATVYAVGVPLFNPAIPTLMIKASPAQKRGLYMGIDSVVNTVSRSLAPMCLGVVYHTFSARACFQSAGLCVLGAIGSCKMLKKYM